MSEDNPDYITVNKTFRPKGYGVVWMSYSSVGDCYSMRHIYPNTFRRRDAAKNLARQYAREKGLEYR